VVCVGYRLYTPCTYTIMNDDDDDDAISKVMRHVDDAFILHFVNYKDLAA